MLERALDVLFILHADHEQNCSTTRCVASAPRRPIRTRRSRGAAAALYGPLHGGANEAVLRMLREIGSVKNVPAFIKRVKAGEGRLMGFGHRVYKNYDPRAKIIKEMAHQVFEVTGRNPLLDIALELERIALDDEYFVKRKLYPNVDFYSGLIYQAMGFPVEMFPVLFAIPRTVGWLAQWHEMLRDPEQKIARPRQVYTGYDIGENVDGVSRAGGSCVKTGLAAGGWRLRRAPVRLEVNDRTGSSLQPSAPSLSRLPDHYHLPRLHRAPRRVSAIGPPHIDLVHQLRRPQAEVGSRIVCAQKRVPRRDITELGPAGGLDRDTRADGIGLALAADGGDREPCPGGASVVQQARGGVEVRDQQIELAVVVIVPDREPTARERSAKPGPASPATSRNMGVAPGPRFSARMFTCAKVPTSSGCRSTCG